MKTIAYILSIFIIGLTAKPLIHHYAHEHSEEHAAINHCSCNNQHLDSDHELENADDLIESICHSEIDEGNCSCCSDDDHDTNCGDEGHHCDGHCNCAFSVPSTFSIEKTELVTVAEFSIIRKYIFIAEYHFELPNIIWHPPKSFIG